MDYSLALFVHSFWRDFYFIFVRKVFSMTDFITCHFNQVDLLSTQNLKQNNANYFHPFLLYTYFEYGRIEKMIN